MALFSMAPAQVEQSVNVAMPLMPITFSPGSE
jgi:hypothetical protein